MSHRFDDEHRLNTVLFVTLVVIGVVLVALLGVRLQSLMGATASADETSAATTGLAPHAPSPATATATATPQATTAPTPPSSATTTSVEHQPTPAAREVDDTPVVVSGVVAWTDTGLDVAAGDLVHFRAEGTVAHAAPDPGSEVGPGGDPIAERAWANRQVGGTPLPGNHAGLIGRIGDGPPFVLGEAGTVPATGDGRLFLGVNDQGLDNNTGEFSVVLDVQPT